MLAGYWSHLGAICATPSAPWIPAFAGMTIRETWRDSEALSKPRNINLPTNVKE